MLNYSPFEIEHFNTQLDFKRSIQYLGVNRVDIHFLSGVEYDLSIFTWF